MIALKGIGAVVFLVVFFALLSATLAVPYLPIGRQLCGLFGVPPSDYPMLEISVTTLVSAVLNGVFYGIIAWLVFTFGSRYRKQHTI